MRRFDLLAPALALAVFAAMPRPSHGETPTLATTHDVGGQFTISLPDGWSVYDQSAIVLGAPATTGVVVFSAEPLPAAGQATADPGQLARVDRGELPSFFVDRQRADKGMTCALWSRTAIYNLGTRIVKDPAVSAGRRHFSALAPDHTPITLGGCQGVRFLVEARKGDPERHWIIDVRAVSDGQTLYLFSLRQRADHHARNLAAFEAALATVRLAAAP